ncbi:MAG: DUF3618 domain-containing protein [Actinomycetota bacterium]|nr:DUF3618 domain-containing protein [Actinomycetota bacterium]
MGERPDRPEEIGRDPLDRYDAREPISTEREIRERAGSGGEVAQTRAEIERTRADMGETVDALQQRLSPQNIKEQAKVQAKETAREAGTSFMDRIKQNPVPAAMVGIGLGWLFMSGREEGSGQRRYREGPYYYDERPVDRSYPAYYEESGRLSTGQSRAQEAARQARERASQLGEGAQERASQLSEGAQEQAQRAKGGFQRMLQENPLAVGALAVGVGAAVGFSVPETQKENRVMGEARDNLVERGKEKAEELKPKVKSVAEQAQSAARDEAQNQDLADR